MSDNMKRILSVVVVVLLALSTALNAAVTVTISEGISDMAAKAKMERTMSSILNEALNANNMKRSMNFASLGVSEDVQSSLAMLWENSPFTPMYEEIVERCLTTGTGYQIRNIELELVDAPEDDNYKQAVFNFDRRGNMTGFNLAIDNNLYMNVIRENKELTDLNRRHLILDYVEQFRTAYNQKDIDFLENIFSDDALIITGKVVKRKTLDGVHLPDTTILNSMGKKEYIRKLKEVFKVNKYIHVTFDEILVNRHSNKAYSEFYGVTLHQGYTSDKYHDDGYLFLLWDFRNPSKPQIHVRAWQPDAFDEGSGRKTRIPKDEILGLEDFGNLNLVELDDDSALE